MKPFKDCLFSRWKTHLTEKCCSYRVLQGRNTLILNPAHYCFSGSYMKPTLKAYSRWWSWHYISMNAPPPHVNTSTHTWTCRHSPRGGSGTQLLFISLCPSGASKAKTHMKDWHSSSPFTIVILLNKEKHNRHGHFSLMCLSDRGIPAIRQWKGRKR